MKNLIYVEINKILPIYLNLETNIFGMDLSNKKHHLHIVIKVCAVF